MKSPLSRIFRCLLGLIAYLVPVPIAFAATTDSRYLSLATDVTVTQNNIDTTILTTTFSLSSAQWVLVQSDGRYFPTGGTCFAWAYIWIDGVNYGSTGSLDWRSTPGNHNGPIEQHSFNVISARNLAAGSHTIRLMAKKDGTGSLVIGSTTNLCVIVKPATNVMINTDAFSGTHNFCTNNNGPCTAKAPCTGGAYNLPHTQIVANVLTGFTQQDLIALAAGNSQGSGGDAMWGIYDNGISQNSATATWTLNDLGSIAEVNAPMYCHAFFTSAPAGNHTISLEATELPLTLQQTENAVTYNTYSTALITLYGGFTVRGKGAPVNVGRCTGSNSSYPEVYKTIAIGPNGFYSPCISGCPTSLTCGGSIPCPGTNVLLAQQSFTIPPAGSHNGVVMFMAKAIEIGDDCSPGGTVKLKLKLIKNTAPVTSQWVGSEGVQGLGCDHAQSGRTLSASYLAAGTARLLNNNNYTIQVYGWADGTHKSLGMSQHVPLIFFDGPQ